jgi:hypothetical protein
MRWTAEPGSDLAKARVRAHRALDAYWRLGFLPRKEAYRRLARKLNLSAQECHIGMFDEAQCEAAIKACEEGLE